MQLSEKKTYNKNKNNAMIKPLTAKIVYTMLSYIKLNVASSDGGGGCKGANFFRHQFWNNNLIRHKLPTQFGTWFDTKHAMWFFLLFFKMFNNLTFICFCVCICLSFSIYDWLCLCMSLFADMGLHLSIYVYLCLYLSFHIYMLCLYLSSFSI